MIYILNHLFEVITIDYREIDCISYAFAYYVLYTLRKNCVLAAILNDLYITIMFRIQCELIRIYIK